MLSKEKLIEIQKMLRIAFKDLKEYNVDWYASLRVPTLELERRFKQFLKEMK